MKKYDARFIAEDGTVVLDDIWFTGKDEDDARAYAWEQPYAPAGTRLELTRRVPNHRYVVYAMDPDGQCALSLICTAPGPDEAIEGFRDHVNTWNQERQARVGVSTWRYEVERARGGRMRIDSKHQYAPSIRTAMSQGVAVPA